MYSQVAGIRMWALGGAVGSIILSATRVRVDQSVNSAGLAVQVENGKSDPDFMLCTQILDGLQNRTVEILESEDQEEER